MTLEEKITAICMALKSLGVGRKGDKISFENSRDTLGRVFINSKYIGTFDFRRRTFVD